MKFTIIAPYESSRVDPNGLLAEAIFRPKDSVVLEVSTPIGDNPDDIRRVYINDGTNLLVIEATGAQLSHLWGQLGKALDEEKLDNE